jgi:NADPH:quinone reductase-like Zn-dependent oxidoreductase
MRETSGRGVDVVLNSLSGELLHASWQCVAEFGKMLEIGKRDFAGRAKLSMDLFEANRSFIGVDLSRFTTDRPQLCRRQVAFG